MALVADPLTGVWIADTYNHSSANPFAIVGGTSVAAPSWAGLLALVNQGRVAAGKRVLNGTGATETQQALYGLPQSDYHTIRSSLDAHAAQGSTSLAGLGTPLANRLIPDLIAHDFGAVAAHMSSNPVPPSSTANVSPARNLLVAAGASTHGTSAWANFSFPSTAPTTVTSGVSPQTSLGEGISGASFAMIAESLLQTADHARQVKATDAAFATLGQIEALLSINL